jgi:hypothetical protein
VTAELRLPLADAADFLSDDDADDLEPAFEIIDQAWRAGTIRLYGMRPGSTEFEEFPPDYGREIAYDRQRATTAGGFLTTHLNVTVAWDDIKQLRAVEDEDTAIAPDAAPYSPPIAWNPVTGRMEGVLGLASISAEKDVLPPPVPSPLPMREADPSEPSAAELLQSLHATLAARQNAPDHNKLAAEMGSRGGQKRAETRRRKGDEWRQAARAEAEQILATKPRISNAKLALEVRQKWPPDLFPKLTTPTLSEYLRQWRKFRH